jgi:hypothetical protein
MWYIRLCWSHMVVESSGTTGIAFSGNITTVFLVGALREGKEIPSPTTEPRIWGEGYTQWEIALHPGGTLYHTVPSVLCNNRHRSSHLILRHHHPWSGRPTCLLPYRPPRCFEVTAAGAGWGDLVPYRVSDLLSSLI